jgi:hypothetical protein
MNSSTSLKKQLAKEEKHEDKCVKTALNDLSHAQKLQSEAEKVSGPFHPPDDIV